MHVNHYYHTMIFSLSFLQWLKEEFIEYLGEWQQSVLARDGYNRMQRSKMLLSPETLLGIRITGMF